MSLEKVIKKVQALRDLAARAGTIHEAQAAAAQADALLQKHRLTEAEIEASGRRLEEGIVEDERPVFVGGKRLDSWRTRLSATIAQHYGCASYTRKYYGESSARAVEIRIAGRPSDIEIVRYMFAWLSAEVTRLSLRESGSARHLFKHGAVTGIARTLEKSRKDVNAEYAKTHGPNAAITLASRAEDTEAWMRAKNPGLGSGRAPTLRGSRSDYERGVVAGEGINIGRALPAPVRALPGASS